MSLVSCNNKNTFVLDRLISSLPENSRDGNISENNESEVNKQTGEATSK